MSTPIALMSADTPARPVAVAEVEGVPHAVKWQCVVYVHGGLLVGRQWVWDGRVAYYALPLVRELTTASPVAAAPAPEPEGRGDAEQNPREIGDAT